MTTIGWTHRPETRGESWNPITGCTRVSPGCEMCYAETLSHRLAAMGQPKYQGVTKPSGKWTGKVLLHEEALEVPYRWKKPRTVFVCSMSDLFHEDVPDDFIGRTLAICAINEKHTFLVLTKRAERLAEFAKHYWGINEHGAMCSLPANVWLGVSVEDQPTADERIPHLLEIPAAVRFLSVEPLLGPVDLSECLSKVVHLATGSRFAFGTSPHGPPSGGLQPGVDWVIAGGESGPGARACHLDWLRSIRDQCAHAGVPFFLKQLGAEPWDKVTLKHDETPHGSVTITSPAPIKDGHGKKKRAGDLALLDGELHHEWPEG
ncbi:MAG: phage Gp37/Gp68 family protein [bacterium]|nr:phage Gp37/Gp68 family protein [bacterium]